MTALLTALTVTFRQEPYLGPRGVATVHFASGTTREQLDAYAQELVAHLGGPNVVEYDVLVTEYANTVTVTQLPILAGYAFYAGYRNLGFRDKTQATIPYTERKMAVWFARVARFAQPIAESALDGVLIEQSREDGKVLEYAIFRVATGRLNEQHAKYLKRLRNQPEVLRAEIIPVYRGNQLVVSLKLRTLNQALLKQTVARLLLNVGIALRHEPSVQDNFRAVMPKYDRPRPTRSLRQIASSRHQTKPRGRRLVS